MKERLKQLWNTVLFTPASRLSLVAARSILCLYTLWLLLSRPGLWTFAEWPAPFRQPKYATQLLRFGLFNTPPQIEHVLYLVMFAALIAALAGFLPRFSCLLAAILVYHFALFEELLVGVQTNGATGFAISVLGLAILSFVPQTDKSDSEDYRWPVVLLQFLLSLTYLLGGLSKLRFSGISWYLADNLSATMREMATLADAPWATRVASNSALVWLIALATLSLELLFPLAIVSRKARWILVPAALIAHWLRTRIYGFYFMSWPLLLLFVNWDWVFDVLLRRRVPSPEH